jgi:DNA-binding NarL/FixJ family response regulator
MAIVSRECAVVISNDRLMSYALMEILSESLGFRAICELRRVSDVRRLSVAAKPGLVIIASALLRDNAKAKLRRLRRKFGPDARIAILAAARDVWNDTVSLADATFDDRLDRNDVIESLGATLRGESVVKLLGPDHVATEEWERLAPLIGQLRPRTRQVLDLMVSGYSGSDISNLLGVSQTTVKWNVSAMLAVFGVSTRVSVMYNFAKMRWLGVF